MPVACHGPKLSGNSGAGGMETVVAAGEFAGVCATAEWDGRAAAARSAEAGTRKKRRKRSIGIGLPAREFRLKL
ncbi:hypothetical protein GCM10022270_09670 [Terriglobus aquaticus]